MLHLLCFAAAAAATIDAGRPVRVRVTARVALVDDRPIVATVVDPIYVHDSIVVAAGATVEGRLQTFRGAATREQAAAMAGGDLTPPIGARVRFETLTPPGELPIRIIATAPIDVDEVAPTTGEWVKDYLLTQLPFHRRYAHRGAVLTMTFVEPVSRVGAIQVPARCQPGAIQVPAKCQPGASQVPGTAAPVPARLLTPLDTATASVGDAVQVQLMAPLPDADGETSGAGTIVTGTVIAVSRARAFGHGGRVTVRFDGRSTAMARSDPPIRFIWPPLATLALLSARDPSTPGQSTFFGRAGAGWSGFLVIGAAVAQISEPVAIGFGVWGLVHTTWINVLRKGRDVVLPADSIVLLSGSR